MTGDVYALLYSFSGGAFLIGLWAVFSAMSKAWGFGRFMNAVLDVCWWIVGAILYSYILWRTVAFNLRIYQIGGAILGGVICYGTLKKPIEKVFFIFFQIFLKIIKFILKILLTPWTFLYKILVVPIMRKVFKKARKAERND